MWHDSFSRLAPLGVIFSKKQKNRFQIGSRRVCVPNFRSVSFFLWPKGAVQTHRPTYLPVKIEYPRPAARLKWILIRPIFYKISRLVEHWHFYLMFAIRFLKTKNSFLYENDLLVSLKKKTKETFQETFRQSLGNEEVEVICMLGTQLPVLYWYPSPISPTEPVAKRSW